MRPHHVRAGKGVACRPGFAGDFEPACLDEAPEGAPDGRRAELGRDMAPDVLPPHAGVPGDMVENSLVHDRREAYPSSREMII